MTVKVPTKPEKLFEADFVDVSRIDYFGPEKFYDL